MSESRLGNYELLERLAGGGQASVHKARHIETGELVALKRLHAHAEDDPATARFRREVEILRRISHRNIVRYRDSFTCVDEWGENQECLVMELLEGETLKERLKKHPMGIPLQEAKDILRQCLEGLAHVFEQHGITHRDIKPSNFFILKDGTVKLLDFGIAQFAGDATMATGSGDWVGSFDYMAPDFVTDKEHAGDQISDIFSLTVCFYEALTGRLPFPKLGEHPELEYFERWSEQGSTIPSHAPVAFRVVRRLTAFIDKGLKADRSERYASYREMLAALEQLQARVIPHGKDGYELIEGLGKGGFGEVYKARRLSDGRILAIKRLYADRSADRFLREAEILRKCRHRHLVEYLDFFKTDEGGGGGSYFLVLEYLEGMPGMSLRDRIREAPDGLDAAEAMKIFAHCLAALDYLHQHGIIHRDIKPANIYAPAGATEQAKILDLGIARDIEGTQTQGAIPGTWDYMAPEFVLDNSRGSAQSDLYAVGLALYEALNGTPAYPRITGAGQKAITEFVARATGTSKSTIDYDRPVFEKYPALAAIIRRATERDPALRQSSAGEMRAEILTILKEMGEDLSEFGQATMFVPLRGKAAEPAEKGAAGAPRRTRTILAVAGAVATTLALVAIGWWQARNSPPSEAPGTRAVRPGTPTPPTLPPPSPTSPTPGQTAGAPVDPAAAEQARLAEERRRLEEEQKRLEDERRRIEEQKRLAALKGDPKEALHKEIEKLVQTLALQSTMGLDTSSPDACVRDARRRATALAAALNAPVPSAVLAAPEVLEERRKFWAFLARDSVQAFEAGWPREARFLAVGRGALAAALALYERAENPRPVLDDWTERWRRGAARVEPGRSLPFPFTKEFLPDPDRRHPPVSAFAATSPLHTGAILPDALLLRLSRSQGDRTLETALRFCLVPEGSGKPGGAPADARELRIAAPFYMAATETSVAAMRAYRFGAAKSLARDPGLARFFSGTARGIALEPDEAPYAKAQPEEALEFCNWLSEQLGVAPVYFRNAEGRWQADLSRGGFRLPTRREWEYAARYGFDWNPLGAAPDWQKLSARMDREHPDDLVWFYYKKEPRNVDAGGVRLYPLGLRDLCGNVGELCMTADPETERPVPGLPLVVCGGSYKSKSVREVLPDYVKDYTTDEDGVGFRVVLPAPIEKLD